MIVDADLPVRRVLALMTGGDGGVVSELRGLTAWLAVHSRTSRAEIVERDPIGTILYGDVRGFSPDEKRGVLECLKRETERNPWSRNVIGLDPRLGSLAAVDMEEFFRGHLRHRRPADYTDWCLDRATAVADHEAARYFMHEVALSVHRRRHDEGLSREVVEKCIGGNAALRQVFAERLAELEGYDAQDARLRQEDEALDEAWVRMRQRERREWREAVTSQQAALREGRGDSALLDQLALAWFGGYVAVEGDTPADRLRCLLGDDDLPGDDDPIQAVLDALRGTVGRPDVPDPSEIVRLHSEHRRHRLALPFLAGMRCLLRRRGRNA